jgi:hypothetical protein
MPKTPTPIQIPRHRKVWQVCSLKPETNTVEAFTRTLVICP